MGNFCVDIAEVSESITNAWRCADAHQNQSAEVYFQDAVRIDSTIHSTIEYAEFLADCVSTDRAIEELETSLDSVRNNDCKDDFILICNRIAALYRDIGNKSQSFRYQQYAISAEMNYFGTNSASLLHRSSTLGFAHDLVKNRELTSAKFLLTSLSIDNDAIGNEARLALADLYFHEEEYPAAHFLLDQATQWLSERNENSQLVQTLKLRSQLLTAQKEFITARESLDEAIALSESSVRCSRLLPQLRAARRQLSLQMSVLCQKTEWN